MTGYLPAYIPTPDKNNHLQIRPTNLITGVYWFDRAKNRPVFTWQVQQALFEERPAEGEWKYRARDPQGVCATRTESSTSRRPFTTRREKIALVQGLLRQYAGVTDPELRIEVAPWAMSHSIVGKGQAIKECTACHSQ